MLNYILEISRWDGMGEGNGTPLQYSCLENPMDGGAWWAAVHGVTNSWTRLSDFTFTFHFPALEKEMATHSSALAWRIPGTGEPGGLPSMGSRRVGHDWSDLAAAAFHCIYVLMVPCWGTKFVSWCSSIFLFFLLSLVPLVSYLRMFSLSQSHQDILLYFLPKSFIV